MVDQHDPLEASETIVHSERPDPHRVRHFVPLPDANTQQGGIELDLPTAIAELGHTLVALRSIVVYPTGFLINVTFDLSSRDPNFTATYSVLSRSRAILRLQGSDDGRNPTFTLDHGDGTVTSTDDIRPEYSDTETPTQDHVLLFNGGSWLPLDNGDQHFETMIWSWPLPPARALTFTAAWPALDLEPTSIRLDGATISAPWE